MPAPAPTSLREIALLAALCVAGAAALARAAAVGDPRLHVPAAVAYLCAAAFAAAALALLARGLGRERAAAGAAGVLLLAMAGIGGWLAVGPGARACTGDGGAPPPGGGPACRLAFGAGAAVTAALGLWAAYDGMRRRPRTPDAPRGGG